MAYIHDEVEVAAQGEGNMYAIPGLIPIDIIDKDNVSQMREYLNAGGSPNFKFTGSPLLSHARSVEMAQLLIDRGADLHFVGLFGFTPLLEQALHKNAAIMKLLLDTDPTLIYDKTGPRDGEHNVLHVCISHFFSKRHYDEQLECVKVVLANEPKIDVNMRFPHSPPVLNKAVKLGHIDIIKLLLENGATPELDPGYENYPSAQIVKDFASTRRNNNSRNIPRGITSELTFDDIEEGNLMVNFPTNNTRTEYNFNRYYKNSPQIRGMPTHPQTRKVLKPTNFKRYRAHLVNTGANTPKPGASRKTIRRREQRARAKAREIQSKAQTTSKTRRRKSRKGRK